MNPDLNTLNEMYPALRAMGMTPEEAAAFVAKAKSRLAVLPSENVTEKTINQIAHKVLEEVASKKF
jgi:hypothetical protein